ncbi:MAG: hypothetical protein KC550_06585, partial [Nanoarchaeota archaeon]|nr:hypothetical protein [Nanoarchaeota archaeon]
LEDINFNYLNKSYVNELNPEIIKNILIKFNEMQKDKVAKFELNLNENTINEKKLIWHIQRFKEIYINITDGKKRLLDTFTRYLILTIKDKDKIMSILNQFKLDLNLKLDVENRRKLTLNSMKSPAIFIYKDVLTKEQFYVGWPWANNNEPIIQNNQKKPEK